MRAYAGACLCLLVLPIARGAEQNALFGAEQNARMSAPLCSAFMPAPTAAHSARGQSLVFLSAPPSSITVQRHGRRRCVAQSAEPWDLTGQDGGMFSMPRRNASKMGEATETLRRDFKGQVAASQGMNGNFFDEILHKYYMFMMTYKESSSLSQGFLRGALDPLRLKRNVREARVSSLSRMLEGASADPLPAEGVADTELTEVPVSLDEVCVLSARPHTTVNAHTHTHSHAHSQTHTRASHTGAGPGTGGFCCCRRDGVPSASARHSGSRSQ